MKRNNGSGDWIDFDNLDSEEYEEGTFYKCPICGGEYLDTFIVEGKNGEVMCIDCYNERYGFDD